VRYVILRLRNEALGLTEVGSEYSLDYKVLLFGFCREMVGIPTIMTSVYVGKELKMVVPLKFCRRFTA